ncbi:hypothetical protein [Staphylococcus hominis]|uniref:hypothetical protein n=1 Tax=Staphylococcus hominis TaxID=1290 RepID=UPI00069D68D6|nr:hypothetical protein [Staphylococcus hominis]
MAEPTLDELVAFMKKHGVEKVDSITDEKSAIKHFRAASRVYKEERDSFRKQRDELINDMAEVKRKAEAFDEIKHIINEKDVYDETLVLRVEDVVFYCETDISGGSSDGHN